MTKYLTADAIEATMGNFVTGFPTLCTKSALSNKTSGGLEYSFIKIANGSGSGRPAVLFIGGVHGREWLPPDALLTFAKELMQAYKAARPFELKAFSSTKYMDGTKKIPFARFTFPAPDVQAIVDNLDLYILPLVNPDGRAFSQAAADDAHAKWRKNRIAVGGGCVGVDINRNFPIAWDFKAFYDPAALVDVRTSDDPCSDLYFGTGAGSELETQNVMSLLKDKKIQYFIDIHSCAHKLMFAWEFEDDQTADPNQNFSNTAFNGKRDGPKHSVYGEFIPQTLLDAVKLRGAEMVKAMKDCAGASAAAQTSSTYPLEQSAFLYGSTGDSTAWWTSQQFFGGAAPNPTIVYCLESGSFGEGTFWPDRDLQFPKIEREVHAALFAFLKTIARMPAPPPNPAPPPAPPPPAPPPTPGPEPSASSSWCFIATAAYGSYEHPSVVFLQHWRHGIMRRTASGTRIMNVLERIYYSFSPRLARYVSARPALQRCVRGGMLDPIVGLLRILIAATAHIRNAEVRVLVLTVFITLSLGAWVGLIAATAIQAVRIVRGFIAHG